MFDIDRITDLVKIITTSYESGKVSRDQIITILNEFIVENQIPPNMSELIHSFVKTSMDKTDLALVDQNITKISQISKSKTREEIEMLEKAIVHHQDLYYNGEPEITDQEFDALWARLKSLDPSNHLFTCIGTDKICYFAKSKHIIPMGSQEKATNPNEFLLWTRKMNYGKYLVELKLDGISIELQYANGTFLRAITRGDGIQGDDITPNVKKMKGFVPNVEKGFSGGVRGEILLSHTIFDKKYSNQANCRNMASGISKRRDGVGSEDLMVIVYDALASSPNTFWQTESEKLAWLMKSKFDVVRSFVTLDAGEINNFRDKLASERKQLFDFDIDGLVIKGDEIDLIDMQRDRPTKQIAYKFPVEEVISTLKGIEWSESGQYYTPVALMEAVEIGGTMVRRASLANPNLIKTLNLKIGDHILVSKRGEIIPKIERVVFSPPDATPIVIPEVCNTCGSKLINSGTHLLCPNPQCDKKKIHRLRKWLDELEIKDLGDSMLDKLFTSKLVTKPADFYYLTLGKMKSLSNVGDVMATKIMKNILDKNEISLPKFIAGFDIEGVGESMVERVVKGGFNTLDAIHNASISDLMNKGGLGEITAQKLAEGMRELYPDMMAVLYSEKIKIAKPPNSNGKLKGLSFCFTGALESMKRAEAQSLVVANGGSIKESVVKGLTYLVTNDTSSGSVKNQKASQLGIKIINEKQFLALLK